MRFTQSNRPVILFCFKLRPPSISESKKIQSHSPILKPEAPHAGWNRLPCLPAPSLLPSLL